MEEVTYHVTLRAKNIDLDGYTTYVFENLKYHDWYFEYIMCVQFPNWDQPEIQIGDSGYVNVKYVEGGISQWYDGEKLNVYKNTNVVFLKFIKEPEKVNIDFLVD